MNIHLITPSKLFILIGFTILVSLDGVSQLKQFDFGIVTEEDLSMKSCEFEPDAEAMVLFDIGETSFVQQESGYYEMKFKRTKRIKIFKNAENWSAASFRFLKSKAGEESISEIKGFSHSLNADGTMHKVALPINLITEEKIDQTWSKKKLPFLEVKDGSIVEFSYEKTSEHFEFIEDWYFQGTLPTAYSHYLFRSIPIYEYALIKHAIDEFSYENRYMASDETQRTFGDMTFHDQVYEMAMENIPSFKDDSFIALREDHLIHLDLKLRKMNKFTGTSENYIFPWPRVVEVVLDESMGRLVKKAEKSGKELVDSLSLNDISAPDKKVEIIINLVKQNFSSEGDCGFSPKKSINGILKSRSACSADLNIFTVGLLRSAGIESHPVLLSTRNNGKINYKYPSDEKLNYTAIFVKLEDRQFVTDVTNPMLDYDLPPTHCINEYGLVAVESKEDKWVSLSPARASQKVVTLNHQLIPEASDIESRVVHQTTGYLACELRERLQAEAPLFPSQKVSSLVTRNADDYQKPLLFSYTINQETEKTSNRVSFKPFGGVVAENPFVQQTRNAPVDLIYPVVNSLKAQITLPEGYKFEQMPKDFDIDNEQLYAEVRVNGFDQMATISCQYQFNKNVYQAEEYKALKESYQSLLDQLNRSLVIVSDNL